MPRFRQILVPTDFSQPAETARRYAQALAKQFGGRVHLLHVVAEPFVYDAWGTDAGTLQAAGIVTQLVAAARRDLDRLGRTARARGVREITEARAGLTVPEILDYIGAHKIDLVVMGTHGRGIIAHALLGSVAEKLVRLSPAPVLTVHGRRGRSGAAVRRAASPGRRARRS